MSSQQNQGAGGAAGAAVEMVALPPQGGSRRHLLAESPPRRPIIFSPERPAYSRPVVICVVLSCIIFWAAVVCTGLAVLIIDLIYHPKLPVLSLDSASLNAGYIDELTVSGGPSSGLALNADVTMLAVISSNNTKVDLELHYMQLDLYFNGHMIGTQVLNPPVRERHGEHVLQSVHFVASDVPLPQEDAEAWRNATANGGPVVLQLAGIIRTRLRIGLLRRIPMKVYPHCRLSLMPPPRGTLLRSQCKQ